MAGKLMQLARRLTPNRVKHWIKLALVPQFRREQGRRRRSAQFIERLRAMPRFQPGVVRLPDGDLAVHIVDAASCASAYVQILEAGVYRFTSDRDAPRILDCGANIGLAVLYWKRLYPRSRIIAFEPDPGAFAALERNCRQWGFDDVELIPKAVWTEDGEMTFWVQGADGGRLIDQVDSGQEGCISVPTVRLRSFLEEPVQLLKLDIEGAEADVLLDCSRHLQQVDNLFVEYHSFLGKRQRLGEIVAVLQEAGFRLHIQPELVSAQPLVERGANEGMDQRLNLFAYREGA